MSDNEPPMSERERSEFLRPARTNPSSTLQGSRCTLPNCGGLLFDGMCPAGYGRTCEGYNGVLNEFAARHPHRVGVRVVDMAMCEQLDADGLPDVARICRRYAVDRPRWWRRFRRRGNA